MMREKGNWMKKACYLVFIIFAVLGLMSFVGCSSSGDGETSPQTFTTSNFFPLTSGWETDRWTLFVDVSNHDINGTTAKAMVDTRGPNVHYWTNDENGLRLHGDIDEDGTMATYSGSIVFADSSCKVGDKKEGTVTIDGEELNYSIEIAGVEDVTVPAGTFANCLKVTLLIYPSADLSSNYGYETIWLAENVGFVKAEADEDAESEIFVDAGDTRQLLSYYITDPTGLSEDELAVRDAYIEFNDRFLAEDLNGMMSMVSDNFYDERCRDKDEVENSWGNFLNSISDYYFYMNIENITIDGDIAYVLREGVDSWTNDATSEKNWSWSRALRPFRRENGEWKYYGAQLGFNPNWYSVYARNTIYDGEKYPIAAEFNDCADNQYIDTLAPISTFTISGPSGSGLVDVDLIPYWDDTDPSGWRGFWNIESLTMGVSGFYTFRVENQAGDYFVYTDYFESTSHMDLPVIVSPADWDVVTVGEVILDWGPVDQADDYRVDMRYSDDGGTTWNGMPSLYTVDTQATVTVEADTRYQWRIRARQYDNYGEQDNESRSDWMDFATYDVITIGGFLQYRTYSDVGDNKYRGWLDFTKNNNSIEESDITNVVLEDGLGSPVSISSYTFYASNNFWGQWNESTSSVDFSGPYSYSGFSISFPGDASLSADNYTYEATTSQGDTLTLTKIFPGGKPLSAVTDVTNMDYQWLSDGSLHLTWSIPAGTFDEFRIVLMDQDWDDLLSVRLPPDKEELTVPSEWIQQISDLKDPSSANWQIQTRLNADNNNYARGYSDNVEIPWNP